VLGGSGPIPGGALDGELKSAPADWGTFLASEGAVCEVESRREAPHSIQLYCFVHDRDLYAQSHCWALAPWWPTQGWASIWLENPEVRVQIGDALFDLVTVPVTHAEVREPVIASLGYDRVPDGIVLFRFGPRE
jgi:hypothetical protein